MMTYSPSLMSLNDADAALGNASLTWESREERFCNNATYYDHTGLLRAKDVEAVPRPG